MQIKTCFNRTPTMKSASSLHLDADVRFGEFDGFGTFSVLILLLKLFVDINQMK